MKEEGPPGRSARRETPEKCSGEKERNDKLTRSRTEDSRPAVRVKRQVAKKALTFQTCRLNDWVQHPLAAGTTSQPLSHGRVSQRKSKTKAACKA